MIISQLQSRTIHIALVSFFFSLHTLLIIIKRTWTPIHPVRYFFNDWINLLSKERDNRSQRSLNNWNINRHRYIGLLYLPYHILRKENKFIKMTILILLWIHLNEIIFHQINLWFLIIFIWCLSYLQQILLEWLCDVLEWSVFIHKLVHLFR